MAVTITRTTIRQEMLKRAPILGRALTADSLTKAGTTLTHIAEYERQRAGLTSFENQYVHRYLQPDPDRWRLITALNSGATDGVINVDGPVWANNTDLAYERLTVHPDDLNFAIAEGQRRQRRRTNIALVRGHDMDMELAGTNYWGTVVALGGSSQLNVTLTKVTTDVFSGTQGMTYAATGAGSYSRGEVFNVSPNRLIYVACIARPVIGTLNFKLRDVTNGVYIGTTVSLAGQRDFALMEIQAQIPANCFQVQVEFSVNGAADTAAIDTCFGPYQAGQTEYNIQSGMDEAYKLRFVRPARYVASLGVAGTADASSQSFLGDLTRPEDWDLEVFRHDVNSNRLRFQANSYNNTNIGWGYNRGYGFPASGAGTFMQNNMCPIWLAMEAQASDLEPLLTETSTTGQPLDECACYSLRYLAETMSTRQPDNPVWANMLQEYKAWSVIEDAGRPPQAMYLPQRYHAIRA